VSLSCGAKAKATVQTSGRNFSQLCHNIKSKSDVPGLNVAVTTLLRFLMDNMAWFSQVAGFDLDGLMNQGRLRMDMKVVVSTGVGVSAKACGGWVDTQGFRMVGASGKATLGCTAGISAFAGTHNELPKIKLIIGIMNFQFTIIITY